MALRRWKQVPGYAGIAKLFVLDASKNKWVETREPQYRATGYRPGPDGFRRRVRPVFKTFEDAKKFRAEFSRERYSAQPVPSPSADMLFDSLEEDWITNCLPHKALPTQIRYKSYLKSYLFFKGMRVRDLHPVTIDKWITWLKHPDNLAKGHTTRCDFHHEFSVLRGILNFYATRHDRNYRLPFIKDHRAMLVVREKQKISKDLTVEEFRSFVRALAEDCLNSKWEPIYYLALMQYAIYGRVQDAAALHYEDFGRCMLTINKKAIWMRAKGHKSYIKNGSKADGGKEIPMPALAQKVFREWTLKSGIREGLLFHLNGELIEYRQIEYRYNRALGRAGLPFTATHIIRHAALCECYEVSEDILTTQKMAGHRDLKSTARYVKARDKKIQQVQRLMDEKLAGLLD